MKHNRQLILLLVLLLCPAAWAQYDPVNPDEPGSQPWQLTLKTIPADAGYFSLSELTRHAAGEQLTIWAYGHNNYTFVRWEDSQGNVLSTGNPLSYTMPARHTTLVARYEYNPGAPEEPMPVTIRRHLRLQASPAEGGSFNLSSDNSIAVGELVHLHAYANRNYTFRNWTQQGSVVSTSQEFDFTMPGNDVTLIANFDYDYQPDSPSEPGESQQEYYNIYGTRVGALAGQTVLYPIYLENRGTAATGMQVDVTMPLGFVADMNAAMLTDRAKNHSLQTEHITDDAWRITVSSAEAIDGVGGAVLTIPVLVPDTAQVGNVFPITLKEGLVFLNDGSQRSVRVRSGSLSIQRSPDDVPDSPDYIVTDVQTTTASVMPGGAISLSWMVKNQGKLPGLGGWTERIYLVDADGRRVSIGSTSYDTQELKVGASVNRNATVSLPQLPGIDGEVDVAVTVVPVVSAGEATDFATNNTAQTAGRPLAVGKHLVLTVPTIAQQEGEVTSIRCQLARSGSWNKDQTFAQAKLSGDDRVTMPPSVTIPREQAAAYFYLTLTDDEAVNTDSLVTLRLDGNGYDAVEGTVTVRDDERPSLRLTASKTEVTEGESFELTVSVANATSQALAVSITAEQPKRFRLPATIIIPAGETEANAEVTANNDEIPDADLSCAFAAHAEGYEPTETLVILKDDDRPVLELTFTPNQVKENDGPVSVTGVLCRTTNIDKNITVRLSDDANGNLYYTQKEFSLPKGVQSATFNLGPVDNGQVDGDRTYTVTAAVWLSSCSCSASGQSAGSVQARLQVFDDDGPSLALTTSQGTVREGVTTRITVNRNTDTSRPLTVYLSSNHDEMLTYNHTLTIPAGQQSAYVEVTPAANDTQDDSQTIVFTAQADGFSSGTCYVFVTDQTLPDARIVSFSADHAEAELGSKVSFTVVVANNGVADLRDATPVYVYLRNRRAPVARLYTAGATPAGQQQVLVGEVEMTAPIIGENYYYAVVNEGKKIQELSYSNNTSADIVIRTLPSFRATVSTDKSSYRQGDEVIVTGQLAGRDINKAFVDVYLVNEGARQVQRVQTDGDGRFQTTWQLLPRQAGHFAVGACYPDEGSSEELASFNVYGLQRTDSKYITCDVAIGEPYQGKIELTNPGNLPLTDVKTEILSAPEGCTASFNIPATINGGQTIDLDYTLNGNVASSGSDWECLKVRVSSSEGAQLNLLLYYFCRNAEAKLTCNVDSLRMTVTKGTFRDIPLQLTNTGKGETGIITPALPDGFKLLSGSMSLKQNEDATLVLRFSPTERMQLNVPMTGTIGLNCPGGNGITLPFSMTLVSEEKGFLIVDACDEYTYNTEEAPHVEGANVTVRHPATNEIVAQGKTGKDGKYKVELIEGYYRLEVAAEKHENYANYVFVNPGSTERITVNIGYQPITISWDVKETEVEDEYTIVTNVVYETNVPMPVVKMELPEKIDGDNMAVGEAVLIEAKLTNIGLIQAEEVTLELPEDTEEWHFDALTDLAPFTLMPSDSVIFPIKITRIGNTSQKARKKKGLGEDAVKEMFDDYANCMRYIKERYKEKCGLELKTNEYAERLAMKICAYEATASALIYILGQVMRGDRSPLTINDPFGEEGDTMYGEIKEVFNICDPCQAKKANDAFNFAASKLPIPFFGKFNEGIDKAAEQQQKERNEREQNPDKGNKGDSDAGGLIKDTLKEVGEAALDNATNEAYSKIKEAGEIVGLIIPCEETALKAREKTAFSRNNAKYGWMEVFENIAKQYVDHVLRMDTLQLYAFGDRMWLEDIDEEKMAFMNYVLNLPFNYNPSNEELLANKPSSVTLEDMRAFVDHVDGKGPNSPTNEQLDEITNRLLAEDAMAKEKGFSTMTHLFYHSFDEYINNFRELSTSSVCATISLGFEGSTTMTRQAFRGRLKVFNGHEDTPMQDLKLNLLVRDMQGRVATAHEFQINAESLDGFNGALDLKGGWTLDAGQTGTATILFIPTKYAAPAEPVQYSFGGSITYIDPFTGLEVTRDLYPVVLTVNPSPELDLTYFMQRDIYGDDPLTEEVEPIVPAEFALVINNKGLGDANNVRMVTQQPEIIENEKGLLIDFQLISSQVNGQPAVLSFGQSIANDFGTISARSQAYAQWWLTSTLLGHFINYDVTATHVTSYGNEDLSLLDQVSIHELIHGFTPPSMLYSGITGRGFLVNDVADANDQPDEVYLSDGTQQIVYRAAGATVSRLSDDQYLLTINPSATGWNYGSLPDPTDGQQLLTAIIRQRDGRQLPADNVWQTPVTLRDGKDPVHERRLHYVTESLGGTETWLLYFDKDADPVKIDDLKGVSEKDRQLHLSPMSSLLFVNGDFNDIKRVEITDMRGVECISVTHLNPGQPIHTGLLPAGVYHVRVYTDQGVFGTKVLKR